MNPVSITQHLMYELNEGGDVSTRIRYDIWTDEETLGNVTSEELACLRTLIDIHLGNTPPPPETKQ